MFEILAYCLGGWLDALTVLLRWLVGGWAFPGGEVDGECQGEAYAKFVTFKCLKCVTFFQCFK